MTIKDRARRWRCQDHIYTFDETEALIMGILNVTPDSFSDGGTHNHLTDALAWARQMRDEGADIIDVGGESTRPGFDETGVSLEEERARVLPVVEALAKEGFVVSVDTSKPEIMQESAQLGAKILNDIRGFTQPGAIEAAAQSGCGLVIMHRDDVKNRPDFLAAIEHFLREQEAKLLAAGADPETLCWDPGFGFGKTVEQNLTIMMETPRFVASGRPYLMGLSRKSSIGACTGQTVPRERVVGSVAGALLSVERGAHIVRVHDCRETKEAIQVWQKARESQRHLLEKGAIDHG